MAEHPIVVMNERCPEIHDTTEATENLRRANVRSSFRTKVYHTNAIGD